MKIYASSIYVSYDTKIQYTIKWNDNLKAQVLLMVKKLTYISAVIRHCTYINNALRI